MLVVLSCLAVGAFVLGAVPFGLIVGRLRGVDVRAGGSGNIGATNVGRLLGRRFFYLTLLLDALKGLVPAAAASVLVLTRTVEADRGPAVYALWLGVGLAAVLGHVFSPLLKFRGGKGIATGAGMLLGLWPFGTLTALGVIAVFVVLVTLTRYISVGSVAAAVAAPVLQVGVGLATGQPVTRQWPVTLALVVLAGLIVWRHRGNLARLRRGEENKIGRKNAVAPTT